jgi:hypothetical protein
MPRIRPFTDFELDPVDRPNEAWTPTLAASVPVPRVPGRHSSPQSDPNGGGRRRRADDSENDTLAQILERESRP